MELILLLGGNENDVKSNIQNAQKQLSNHFGKVCQCSSLYESEPWGMSAKHHFLNQVLEFNTDLDAIRILDIIQSIELDLGRKKRQGTQYESRPIDIDILFYGNKIIDTPRLTIPHALLHQRRFTLLPLMDHWSQLIHPVKLKNIEQLLNECEDTGLVWLTD